MVLEWTLQDMTEDLALLHTSHSSQFASLAVSAPRLARDHRRCAHLRCVGWWCRATRK